MKILVTGETLPLEQGLKEEFLWYKDNLDRIEKRQHA